MWVLDHMEDLNADFRVFYRIDDMFELSGREFMSYALRASAYKGVMRARVEAQQEEYQGSTGAGNKTVESHKAALDLDPSTQGLFD